MKGTAPTLHCDGDDGNCADWEVDYYSTDVSSINGIRPTLTERAPGWVSTEADEDYCPDHAAER